MKRKHPRFLFSPNENDLARFEAKYLVGRPDECWLWTAAKHRYGYGMFTWQKKQFTANRLVLIWATGSDPEGMQACHKCGNPACVNPLHLYWGTAKQNCDDKKKHGTLSNGNNCPQAKYTASAVKEIWLAYHSRSASLGALVKKFGGSQTAIFAIVTGVAWKHVTNCLPQPDFSLARIPVHSVGESHPASNLTASDVQHIRAQLAAGRSMNSLKKEMGTSMSTIWRIAHGKTWKHLPLTCDLKPTGDNR